MPAVDKIGKLYSVLPADGSGDLTVTRAGTTAFTQTPSGYWKPAAANEPRLTYTGGVRGLLVEAAATRLNADPYSIEKPSWTKSGARVEGDPATAGNDILAGWDFTVGFNTSSAVINDSNTFTTAAAGGLFKLSIITVGKFYLCRIKGDTSAVAFNLQTTTGGIIYQQLTGSFDIEFYFQAQVNQGIFLRNVTAGTTNIDIFSVKEVSGFDCPFVDANGINTKQGRKLVATANNGSVKLATPVAVTAATSYVNYVYIKRLVGTGTIYLVDVNNTDRAVTVTSEWTRVQYAAAAAGATGQLGIKMATAGDEVMVCYMPIEAGTVATSPIGGAEGATQTRNADVETVNVPAGVTQIILTNMNDVETIVTSFSSPYQIPVGTWKSIIMK